METTIIGYIGIIGYILGSLLSRVCMSVSTVNQGRPDA